MPAGESCVQAPLMTGRLTTTKSFVLTAVPLVVTTVIGPALAPDGTVAVICELESIVKLAPAPSNVTDVVPSKFVPVMTTLFLGAAIMVWNRGVRNYSSTGN